MLFFDFADAISDLINKKVTDNSSVSVIAFDVMLMIRRRMRKMIVIRIRKRERWRISDKFLLCEIKTVFC